MPKHFCPQMLDSNQYLLLLLLQMAFYTSQIKVIVVIFGDQEWVFNCFSIIGSLHILALEHYLPSHDESGEFHIPYPPTGEIYVFNRYGQHVATKDLASAKTIYSFLYSKNTSFGKLSTVTDSTGNKIQFLRDYSNVVSILVIYLNNGEY